MARPLADAGPTFTRMAGAAQKAQKETVLAGTKAMRTIVDANGSRFHIRGRGGDRVPLGAGSDVKIYNGNIVGAVRGVPEGFWHIVEYGSGPHLIVAKRRDGKRAGRRNQLYAEGTLGSGTAPLKVPGGGRDGDGFSQFVHHPGHSSIGTPWAQSMAEGPPVVATALNEAASTELVRTFIGRYA